MMQRHLLQVHLEVTWTLYETVGQLFEIYNWLIKIEDFFYSGS